MKNSSDIMAADETREQLKRFAGITVITAEAPVTKAEQVQNSTNTFKALPSSTDWKCTRCGIILEEASLKVYRSKIAFDNSDIAMCPHCGGTARNLLQIAAKEADELKKKECNRKANLRSGIIIGIASALFLVSPSTFTYLLLWIVTFCCGPLKNIHLKMKLGALFAIMWAGFFGSFVIAMFSMNHLGKLMVWLFITVVIIAAGWMIEKVSSMGGSIFYKV